MQGNSEIPDLSNFTSMKSISRLFRVLTLISLMSFTVRYAMGQRTRWETSVQGGPCLSWIRGEKIIYPTEARIGPAAGINMQYNASHALSIRLGVGYQSKGFTRVIDYVNQLGGYEYDSPYYSKLDYLSVPLMLRYGFGGKVRWGFGAGGFAGFLLGAKENIGIGGFKDQAITNRFEKYEFGLCASACASISLGARFGLEMDVRYDKGFSNINARPETPVNAYYYYIWPGSNSGLIHTDAVSMLFGCSYRFGSAL